MYYKIIEALGRKRKAFAAGVDQTCARRQEPTSKLRRTHALSRTFKFKENHIFVPPTCGGPDVAEGRAVALPEATIWLGENLRAPL